MEENTQINNEVPQDVTNQNIVSQDVISQMKANYDTSNIQVIDTTKSYRSITDIERILRDKTANIKIYDEKTFTVMDEAGSTAATMLGTIGGFLTIGFGIFETIGTVLIAAVGIGIPIVIGGVIILLIVVILYIIGGILVGVINFIANAKKIMSGDEAILTVGIWALESFVMSFYYFFAEKPGFS